MLKIEQLEGRETPSYTVSFNGIVRISSYGVSAAGFVTSNEIEYKPLSDFTGTLNSVFSETNNISIVAPLNNGGPRVQVNQITFGNSNEQKTTTLFDDFVFEPTFHGGVNIAYGDVNNDGVPDLVVGANTGGGPRVRVLSGADNFKTVLYDEFVYESSYRGGVNVGVYDGKVLTLPKAGGGPRLRQIDISTNTSTDMFIGDPNSRADRQLLYGNLLGYEHEYFGNYENKTLLFYDNNGDLLTKNVLPYTVTSIGIGGSASSLMNKLILTGKYANNSLDPNRLYLIEHDPILNSNLSNYPIFQPDAYMGVALDDLYYYKQLYNTGTIPGATNDIPSAISTKIPYPNTDPWRNNFGNTVYSGTSIGGLRGTGTLTTLVLDSTTGQQYALTNYHVAQPNQEVYAPGPADLQQVLTPDLTIGIASKTLGINFDANGSNLIDSTLIDTTGFTRQISPSVLVGQNAVGQPTTINYKGYADAHTGDLVYGFGRSIGPRPGIVQDDNKSVQVNYGESGPIKLANFNDQLYILSTSLPFGFAVPGDSGSIIMKPIFDGLGNVSWYVTGQLFAGNSFFGIAAKWSNIQAMLGIKLDI